MNRLRPDDVSHIKGLMIAMPALEKKFLEHKLSKSMDLVLCENQPLKNDRTVALEWATTASAPRWFNEKVQVRHIPPTWKNRYCHSVGIVYREIAAKMPKTRKTATKNEAKIVAQAILADQSDDVQKQFANLRHSDGKKIKTDDISDAIVQAMAYVEFTLRKKWKSEICLPMDVPANGKLRICSIDFALSHFAVAFLEIEVATLAVTVLSIHVWDLLAGHSLESSAPAPSQRGTKRKASSKASKKKGTRRKKKQRVDDPSAENVKW